MGNHKSTTATATTGIDVGGACKTGCNIHGTFTSGDAKATNGGTTVHGLQNLEGWSLRDFEGVKKPVHALLIL